MPKVSSLRFSPTREIDSSHERRLEVGTVQSVAQSCLTLCDPVDCSMPGFPVLHHHPGFLKLMSIELEMPSTHLVLCHPLLLPSIFLNIGVFSNESALCIRWPKYWNFSFRVTQINFVTNTSCLFF